MFKRKVKFADVEEKEKEDVLEAVYRQQGAEELGDMGDKGGTSRLNPKHSLDSDEEDTPEPYNVLSERDIQGK